MSETSPERVEARQPAPADRLRSMTPKQITSAVGVVVVVVFALINLQNVTMHWIVGTTHTPLIVLVAICLLIGGGVGFVMGRRARAPHHPDS